MAEELFDVYLTGGVAAGQDPNQVAARLASLMRVPLQRASSLLAGSPVCVKRGVTLATATRYQAALAATGANARTQKQTAAVAEPQQATRPKPSTATPTPHPARRRRFPLWPLVAVLLLMALALLAAGYRWLLPTPVPPGQALRQVGETLNRAQPYQQQVEAYWRQHGVAPGMPSALGLREPVDLGGLAQLQLLSAGRLVLTFTVPGIDRQTLVLTPRKGDRGIEWDCRGGTLVVTERPRECQ